jgi:hypothetical protein
MRRSSGQPRGHDAACGDVVERREHRRAFVIDHRVPIDALRRELGALLGRRVGAHSPARLLEGDQTDLVAALGQGSQVGKTLTLAQRVE